MRGTVSNVIEKQGSENARKGDILFGRVVQIDSIAMLMGCGTVLIPPNMKPELIRFRQWLLESDDPITSGTLYEYDLEIRELYFDIFSSLMRPPELQNTEIQSPDAMLETIRDGEGGMPGPGPDQDELMQIPEVREQIEKTLFAHYKNWVDDKIPALGHMTPRQAVKKPDGRESVEALLLDAERHADANEQMRAAGTAAIAEVRRRLGLDKPAPAKVTNAGGEKNADRVTEVKGLIETFGRSRLGREYTGLALKLCDKIGRMRKLSIQRGQVEIWAAAIVHLIARLNFLFDPDNEVYITADELNAYFGTKKSTVSSKAGLIQKTAEIFLGDPDFSSVKIADMLRVYETEDGLLIPGSMLDDLDNQWVADETPPVPPSPPITHKTKRRSKIRAEIPPRDSEKRDVDRRQLKLFDDK